MCRGLGRGKGEAGGIRKSKICMGGERERHEHVRARRDSLNRRLHGQDTGSCKVKRSRGLARCVVWFNILFLLTVVLLW